MSKPEAFEDLTTAATATFNQTHPGTQGVPWLCYSGSTSPSQTMCRTLYTSWLRALPAAQG